MAQISLADNLLVTNEAITGNGVYNIWTSNVINNSNSIPSLRLIIEYANIQPDSRVSGVGNTFGITVVVESQIGTKWFPIAYQFSSYDTPGNGDTRIILLQPDINSDNAGIDDDMYVGGNTIAKTSRQQGKLGSNFRVRLVCQENGYGQAGSFQSVNVSIFGETFE